MSILLAAAAVVMVCGVEGEVMSVSPDEQAKTITIRAMDKEKVLPAKFFPMLVSAEDEKMTVLIGREDLNISFHEKQGKKVWVGQCRIPKAQF